MKTGLESSPWKETSFTTTLSCFASVSICSFNFSWHQPCQPWMGTPKKPCFTVWSRSFGVAWSYQQVQHTPAEDWPRSLSSWSMCWCFCRRRRPPPALSGSQWTAWSGTHSPPGLRCTACWCAERFPSCHLQGHKYRLLWAHPPPACTLSTRLLCHYNDKDFKFPDVYMKYRRHV